jgi:hypothetical protein
MREALREAAEGPEEQEPPVLLGVVVGDGDPFVVTDGPAKGMRGYFARDDDGNIAGVHVGGRMAMKV